MGKKIVILGATGMVGGELLKIALGSDEVSRVISIGRKSVAYDHPKLIEIETNDFSDFSAHAEHLKDVEAAFFCIGVYTGAVAKDKFTEITVDYPINFAKAILEYSPKAAFCLLSGAGADRSEKSRMAFARDKGKVENALSAMGLGAFYTFRPGYIYPVEKRQEPSFMYSLSRTLYPLIKAFGKNASIKSTELAQGIFNVGMKRSFNSEVLENRDILGSL